ILHSLGDVQVIPKKTRLVCVTRIGSPAWPRANTTSWPASRCIAGWTVPGSSSWSTTTEVARALRAGPGPSDLDDELRGWLQEAHDVVGLQAGLTDRPRRRPQATPA